MLPRSVVQGLFVTVCLALEMEGAVAMAAWAEEELVEGRYAGKKGAEMNGQEFRELARQRMMR
jgi:hypothetical protein